MLLQVHLVQIRWCKQKKIMNGIIYRAHFLNNHFELFNNLMESIIWDERMKTRKTASFGKAYNYSQIQYAYQEFTEELNNVTASIENLLGFKPNNCLINLYENGNSTMGFHSDQTEILQNNTGVVIISLGETRTLRFRSIEDRKDIVDYNLPSGSLIYMDNSVQEKWQHAIPVSSTLNARMSLTFRNLK